MYQSPTGYQPVSKGRSVDLDETSTIDKNLWSHVTHCDQLGSVFQTSVVLLQNLHKDKVQLIKTLYSEIRQKKRNISRIYADLKEVGALPRTQTTDKLDQALSVRMSDRPIHVHSNLIDTVDEFTVKSRKQILLHHLFLRKKGHSFHKYVQNQVSVHHLSLMAVIDY